MRGMRRALLILSLALAACGQTRPTEAECQKAIDNMNKLYNVKIEEQEISKGVRRCAAQSTKDTAACQTAAKTIADLEACEKKAAAK
jgi:hypothetical protein